MREPRQIVLIHRTLVDKAQQDVLRSTVALSDIARQAPILWQTCLNSPHTSRQVNIFVLADKKSASVRRPLRVEISLLVTHVSTRLHNLRIRLHFA